MKLKTWLVPIAAILLSLFWSAIAAESGSEKDKKHEWPNWRGSNYTGKASAAGVFDFEQGHGLKVAWKRPLGSGYSSVSVAGGRAITMFSDSTYDYMIAFDADKGDELWRYRIGETYIGRAGGHNGPRSTPMIDGDLVFGLGPAGELFALESKSGKKIWETHLVDDHQGVPPFHGFTTSPLVQGPVLVVETGGKNQNTISGFNKKSGELLWAAGSDSINYQSPVVASLAGEQHLVCAGDRYLYGLDHQTGKMLWEFGHDGGNNSVNPVIAGSNQLMVKYSGRESMLIEVSKQNGEYNVDEVWKSRDIKNSLNTSVYHDGHIYGYSGNFLTCIDAATGKKVWRSRPPGGGFLILVDGHLVILTIRSGNMHIVEASPDGYQEKANLELFGNLTWTPPSFANGRIYARNLYEIASVEIGAVDQLVEIERPAPEIVAPESDFAAFVRKVESAENKQTLIDEFMAEHDRFPIVEDDKLAHIVYRGEAEDLALQGDMYDWGRQTVMHQIPGTDFYHQTVELEPDARLTYFFVKDFEQNIPDPLNGVPSPSIFGQASELRMPEYDAVSHLQEPEGPRGAIDSLQFESQVLENSRTVEVYLPHGYAESQERYPVIYYNYGRQAVRQGKAPNTLDNLIGKTVAPVIAVFIHAPNSFNEYARNLREQYSQMVVEELVPFIDEKYRTKPQPEARAFVGADEGGFSAIFTAFKYPGVFGKIAGQSTHLHPPEGDELRKLIAGSEKLPVQMYLEWGRYDHRNAAGGYNWTENNRNFVSFLKEQGYSYSGGEVSQGFDWGNWRTRTDKILEALFPLQKRPN